MPKPARVYIGLSSNDGDRVANLRGAVGQTHALFPLEQVANLYVVAPMGRIKPNSRISTVATGMTELTPASLLRALQSIEQQMGRRRETDLIQQSIDLDILFYGSLQVETIDLAIPHPRIAQRAYVLKPLVELAPRLMHPILYETMAQLLHDVDEADAVIPYRP